ncbi:Transcription factor WhiB [Streptomyces sp. OspMP-M45]|nr:hypothetical protein [Streptomyces sp. SID4925]SBU97968.1 Transcription factor WhiB [Streptomyces sp. OspMP-M45]
MTTQTVPNRRSTTSAVSTRESSDWRSRSACAEVDPELFFPTSSEAEKATQAKEVCGWCPVRQQCLDWALKTGQDTGVWGGLDERERRAIHGRPSSAQTAPLASVWGADIGEEAVARYLSGADGEVLPQERLEAVARGVRAGMSYLDFDRMHGLAKGATSVFVSRARKVCADKGFTFPDMGARRSGSRVLSDEQVVKLRERSAAGGVTDLELAMQVGVARKTVTGLLSGQSYKDVGGPIRRPRENKPGESTRVLWAGKQAGFSGSKKSVEEAA